MNEQTFKTIEAELGLQHAPMAEALGISEISVKRYATGAQTIPPHISKLTVALLLIHRESLEKKFDKMLAKYHRDTYN